MTTRRELLKQVGVLPRDVDPNAYLESEWDDIGYARTRHGPGTLAHTLCVSEYQEALARGEFPNARQYRNAKKIHDAFAPPFEYMTFGVGHGCTLRLTIRGTSEYKQPGYGDPWVFIIHPNGTCSLNYPAGSPVADLLDSDSPDYNPEAVIDSADHARKRAKEECK